MKAYLSHTMTKATSEDKLFAANVAMWLLDAGVEIWDPEDHEQGLSTMEQFQKKDWNGMKSCDLVVFVWSSHAPESRGMNAEIEWAARCFKKPCLVAMAPGVPIEPWPQQSIMSAPVWGFIVTNNQMQETIRCLSRQMRPVAKRSRSSRVSSDISPMHWSRSPACRKLGTTSTTPASRSIGTRRSRKTKRTPS